MATGTQGGVGREFHQQVVHYLRKSVAFNTTNIATAATVLVGVLPAGALVLGTYVAVTVAFNAATTNVLIVGTAADTSALVAAASVAEGAVASTLVSPPTLAGAIAPTLDTSIFAQYTQTGTAATTGAATIVVAYTVNNDG